MHSAQAIQEQSKSIPEIPGVYIQTFGCQMNEYDTEKLYAVLSSKYTPVDAPESADLIIVNTCSVREKAAHKLYSLLGRFREYKENNPSLLIGVGGCVAQQDAGNIIRRNNVVDFVFGTHNLSLVPSLINAVQGGRGSQIAVDYRDDWEEFPSLLDDYSPLKDSAEVNSSKSFGVYYSSVRAMVAIQRGCNKRCSFCVVPNTRGPEVSRNKDEILREIKAKIRIGAKEVLLLGQTVNSYGRDLEPRQSFDSLVHSVSKIHGVKRIRFTSPHPTDVTKEFCDLYAQIPALCPQIHLPLQSGSDKVLKSMNRNYRVRRYLAIVDMLRKRCPDIAISTDIIVGFPTETREDFELTLDLVRNVQFSNVFAFCYSTRPNTPAALKYSAGKEGVCSESESRDRLQELFDIQKGISLAINQKKLGQNIEILIETNDKTDKTILRGRSLHNLPVEVHCNNCAVGDLVSAKVVKATPYGLRAEVNVTSTVHKNI